MNTRLRYVKNGSNIKLKNDVIVNGLFYNANIDTETFKYVIDTPDGNREGQGKNLHDAKKMVKCIMKNIGARFKVEKRDRPKTPETQSNE